MSGAKFFTWRQNNSGGEWDGPAVYVSIQANGLDDAQRRAEEFGLYFDGSGDCPTCGDRWHSDPHEISDRPEIYGEPVQVVAEEDVLGPSSWLIVYADGREERGMGTRKLVSKEEWR